ncbi:hypothetical protein LK10_03180 [Sinomonas humi]|uniref:Uncharacterized protein n=1 Tax=Sinomonas humi TaxID=1338436 RepID=A0A0B2ASY5_9MICC|nr:hypothetical protein LK10_03180 [Sinomonas humi]
MGLALAGAGVVLGLAWQMVSNSFQSLGGSAVKDTPEQVVSVMLERTFDYARQYVGVMGWLDASLPTVTYVVWDAVAMGLLVGCLALWRGRRRIGIVLLSAVILLLPVVFQIPAAPELGYIWQGRYILPLVVVLLVACGFSFEGLDFQSRPARTLLKLTVFCLGFANFYGFVWVLRRYATGIGNGIFWDEFFGSPKWQPPGGLALIALLYCAITVWGSLACIRYLPRRRLIDAEDEQLESERRFRIAAGDDRG